MREAVEQICRKWRCEDETTCAYSPITLPEANLLIRRGQW
jgi:hypothetical protein